MTFCLRNSQKVKPFSKLKRAFFEYWTSVRITISKTCVSKEYEIKTKMVHEQWLQLKMKGDELTFGWGGMSIFSAGRWLPPSPQQGKPWPNQMSLHWKMKAPFWKMIPWKPNFWKLLSIYVFHFLMLHLAASWPTLGHYQEKCLTHQVLTTTFLSIFNFQKLFWALQWAPSCEPSHAFPMYWLKPYLHKIFKSPLWQSNPLMISAARWNTAQSKQ